MQKSTYRKTLDVLKAGVQFTVDANQGEALSRRMIISVTDGSKPFDFSDGTQAIIYAKKPDSTIVYNNCEINGNKVIFDLTEQTLAAAGEVKARLYIVSSDENSQSPENTQVLYSPEFIIQVNAVSDFSTAVESTNEYTALTTQTASALAAAAAANTAASSASAAAQNISAQATQTSNGAIISITNANGEVSSVVLSNGKDGRDGNDTELTDNCIETNHIKNKAVSEAKLSDSLSDKINMLKAVKASDYVEGNITKNNVRTFLQGMGVNRNSQSVIAAEDITLNFPDCIAYDGVNWNEENVDTWDLTYTIPKGSVFIVSMHNDFCRISFIWLVVADWTVLEIPRSSGSSPKLFWGDLDEKIYMKILSGAYISTADLINQLNNYQKKNIYKANIQIAISDWVEEQTPEHQGYPYRADITVTEATVNHYPEVIFDDTAESEGKIFGKCETGSGVLKIWAKEPVAATIETLKLEAAV